MRHSCLRLTFGALTAGFCLSSATVCRADPTALEQYWLELVNQARRDPAGELERLVNYATPATFANPSSDDPGVAAALAFFGTSASLLATQWSALTPAPALAWSDSLRSSAVNYSGLMISSDQQSHAIDGLSLEDRIANGGYSPNYLDLGETLYATAQSAFHGHAGFMIDWGDGNGASAGFGSGIQNPPSHRELLMDPAFKEIGIGTITSGIPGTNTVATGPVVVTQHLGNKFRSSGPNFFMDSILTGVVYDDRLLANDFYTPGEGLAGVLVEVYDNATNNLLFSGSTNSVGGFNIPMQGVTIGEVLRVRAPTTGLPEQLLTIAGRSVDASVYGVPVTVFDNQYAAFQVVPEPGSLALAVLGALAAIRRRKIACQRNLQGRARLLLFAGIR